ncbi:MAG: Clp protease N-terminal domain-containing protein [Verrucomicrobiota bacterium]
MELAREEAPRFHHDFIGTEHVLLGLLKSEHGVASKVLRRLGVERDAIRVEIEKIVGVGPVHQASGAIPYTPRVRKALQLAASEAKAMNHAHVGTEHIFLGLLIEGSGVAALVLKNLGIHVNRTREEILKELNQNQSNG